MVAPAVHTEPAAPFRLDADGQGGFAAVGTISFENAANAVRAIPARAKAGSTLSIDLARLADADSATLAVLISWAAQAHAQASAIRYFNTPTALRNLARLSDVDALLALS